MQEQEGESMIVASDHVQAAQPAMSLAADAKTAAAAFSVSLRTWRRWDSAGKCPRGFAIGGRKLWRLCDLELWASLGFPKRKQFEALRSTPE